ncbi:HAD family hydrolase [Granulicella aggregans]|jgi:beta-phosphoglucomutase-like phosphatase (HAD superfamily)|uniref:HAD family hydrolase n=1 Tax=Granulicella aggregans TaxID=474949 RepID=UPI0021DF9E21|nr:HAD family phosphatase [Granulicella aggregans]
MADLSFNLDEPYAGLIFDCDGTLVDTAPVHFYAVNEALRSLGLEMSAEWYFARTGVTPAALFAEFEELTGVKIDTEDLSRRYTPIFIGNLDRAEEIAVVADIARANHGKVPMAVGSNGHLENVKATLGATGLLPLFDHIVSADEVEHGKPAPDVYLEAARRIGVAPAECIVFEDTDEGLEAAHRAGMRSRDIREVWKKG